MINEHEIKIDLRQKENRRGIGCYYEENNICCIRHS